MHRNRPQIIDLLQRYLREELTEEDLFVLQEWADLHPDNQKVLDKVADHDLFFEDLRQFQATRVDTKRTLQHVLEKQNIDLDNKELVGNKEPLVSMQSKRNWWGLWPYAAASILLLFGFFQQLNPQYGDTLWRGIQQAFVAPIPQGLEKQGVTLTLSDGNSIQLDDARHAIQMIDNHIYYEDGESILQGNKFQEVTINVPRGEQFQVSLSDGSTVMLNAESSLRYPVVFPEGDRKVALTGEAYFTIAKKIDPQDEKSLVPFTVDFEHYNVQVHGTQFNIRSYGDESMSKVSLVTGKVSVHGDGERLNKGVFLKPGLQASLQGNQAKVRPVNLDQEIAWKNGLFTFDNKPFQDVMGELARWYDIDVEYQGAVPNVSFFGRVHRKEPLLSTLNLLKSADITYRLLTYEGKQKKKLIIINKRKEAL